MVGIILSALRSSILWDHLSNHCPINNEQQRLQRTSENEDDSAENLSNPKCQFVFFLFFVELNNKSWFYGDILLARQEMRNFPLLGGMSASVSHSPLENSDQINLKSCLSFQLVYFVLESALKVVGTF